MSPPMDRLFVFLPLISFFLFLRAASDAAMSPQEAYWRIVLPSTPVLSDIADRLSLAETVGSKEKETFVSDGIGDVHVHTGKPGRRATVNVGGGGGGVHVTTKNPGGGTNVNVGHGEVNVGTGKPGGGGTRVNDGHGGVGVQVGPSKGYVPYYYGSEPTETQIHDDPNVARIALFFFLESNLRSGAAMTVHFTRPSASRSAFLPRREADAIPFSSARLPEILDRLSIKPGSPEAETTLSTLQECELPAAPGERKLCATSLESMVDFSVANLGTRRVVAASTAVSKAGTPRQRYTIEGVTKAVAAEGQLVVCHAENYAYAVFYCHTSAAARAYTVSLVGANRGVNEPSVHERAWCSTRDGRDEGGGGGCVPHRHGGLEPQPRGLQGTEGQPGDGASVPLLAGGPLVWSRSN